MPPIQQTISSRCQRGEAAHGRFFSRLAIREAELDGPSPDGLAADVDPPPRQQLPDVPQTEAEPTVQAHGVADHVRWKPVTFDEISFTIIHTRQRLTPTLPETFYRLPDSTGASASASPMSLADSRGSGVYGLSTPSSGICEGLRWFKPSRSDAAWTARS